MDVEKGENMMLIKFFKGIILPASIKEDSDIQGRFRAFTALYAEIGKIKKKDKVGKIARCQSSTAQDLDLAVKVG